MHPRLAVVLLLLLAACGRPPAGDRAPQPPEGPAMDRANDDRSTPPTPAPDEATAYAAAAGGDDGGADRGDNDGFAAQRRQMVARQIQARDVDDLRVLAAMETTPRHRFVPPELVAAAYDDRPLSIGHGQTISQPYIVALMTQAVRPKPESVALDVGTGSGYQAAVLAQLCKHVYSIEIVPELAEQAQARLAELGYRNVTCRAGDGYRGWAEHAPFDVIIVAAAPPAVPRPLLEQLKPGGRLVIPVGVAHQQLLLYEKDAGGTLDQQHIAPVAFVPMTGEAQRGADEGR